MEDKNYPNTRSKKRKGEVLESPKKQRKCLEKSENDKNSSEINMGKINPSDKDKKNVIELNVEELAQFFGKKNTKNNKKNKRVNLSEEASKKQKLNKSEKYVSNLAYLTSLFSVLISK